MFLLTATKMSEFMTINPSHFGLKQLYIDSFCQSLGIVIKISDVSVGPSATDTNEGCCSTRCTFLLTHIIPRARDNLRRPAKKSFHMLSFDDTEEKVAVRFEGENVKMQYTR